MGGGKRKRERKGGGGGLIKKIMKAVKDAEKSRWTKEVKSVI